MSRVSSTLRRLVVVGAGTAVIGTGIIPLATTANAATVATPDTATSTSISPTSDTETAGACNPYTVTTQANAKFDVQISQQDANDGATSTTVDFCDVSAFTQFTAADNPVAGPNVVGGSNTCPDTATTAAGPPVVTDTASCDGQFAADGNGKLTFGVTSDQAGTMNIVAYNDANHSETFDQSDTAASFATKTWVANTPASSNGLTCSPTSSTGPTFSDQVFRCRVVTGSGTGVTGQTINYIVKTGPDAGQQANCPEDLSNATGSGGGQFGYYDCDVFNGGGVGTDNILIYDDANANNIPDTSEASTTVTATWVNSAPVNAFVTLTCSPNPSNSTSTACQEPTSSGTATFTATLTAGQGGSPLSGYVINFGGPNNIANPDAGDSESISPKSCVTDSNGQCSTTLTDSKPSQDETLQVTANAPIQGGGNSNTASATITFHTPTNSEARNITVSPKSATQQSGGAQTFTAKVVDRFGNAVVGYVVNWSESGPGGFRGGSTCTTGNDGTCSLDVTSLASEQGAETVTASLDAATTQCDDASGSVNGTPNQTPAPAGNCSDNGTVTWTKSTPPPSKTRITASINCWSPKRHVLKCKVVEAPAKAGLTVVFKRVTASGTKKIGVGITNSNGVAKITKRHLKSHKIWRVFAHVRSTSSTTGATTGIDKTRIK